MPSDETPGTDELAALEEEEQELSAQRRRLFERIDRAADTAAVEHLRKQERELSDRRRALHARIDALREQRAAPPPDEAA